MSLISLRFRTFLPLLVLVLLSACASDPATNNNTDVRALAKSYQETLNSDPQDNKANSGLGEILEANGELNAARTHYETALATDNQDSDTWRKLGRVYIKLGQPEIARQDFMHALEIDPHDARALNGLGVALDHLGRHEAAQKAYHEAQTEDPTDLGIVSNLGRSLILSGAYPQAITLLEPAAKEKTATFALRQNLAEAYGLSGMDTDAERILKIDLPPVEVRQRLADFRTRRAKLSPEQILFADLGNYPTQAMAQAKSQSLRQKFAADIAGLVIEIKPVMAKSGGTPSFALRATGFAKAERVTSLCSAMKKAGEVCVGHGVIEKPVSKKRNLNSGIHDLIHHLELVH